MALDTIPLAWFDKLWAHSIGTWGQLYRKFYEIFCSVLTHPSTRNELRTCKQKPDETFQQYYHRFAEIRAQVFDITDREVIDHFTNRIKYKWHFEKFCNNNPETVEEFKRTVQKMIASEERTREWFPRGQQDKGYEPRSNQGGQSDRKRGPDNTLASMDRSKKSNKNNKKFEDLNNLPCPFHKNSKHMAAECRQLQELGFYGKSNKGKGKADNNKNGDDNPDPGFQ